MLSLRLIPVVLCTLILSGCARSPVVQLYDGAAKPDSQVLTVRVPSEIEVFTINGKEVDGVNTFFATDFKELKFTPGRYEILAYYKELWQLDADNHEIVKSNPANFIVDGKAGETWQLDYEKPADVDEARALEDTFSGWVLNTSSGESVAARESGLILKRGFLAPITGVDVSTASSASIAPQQSTASALAPTTSASSQPAPTTSYLDTLKAQWKLATPEERREFLQWVAE